MSGTTIAEYVERQREWSRLTFGDLPRTIGITRHIEKELIEIRAAPYDLTEWIDVVILALDGAWRAGCTPAQIEWEMNRKQMCNMTRRWPNVSDPDEPIEHIRGDRP